MSQAKISRVETARVLPSVLDVERILSAIGVDEETAAKILVLARKAHTEYKSWRAYERLGLHHKQRELAAIEAGSTRIGYFLPSMITGLLQTPEYAQQSLVGVEGVNREKTISARLQRQSILYDATRLFTFILTESAVRWPLCEPSAMAVQMDRITSLSMLPNVRIGIVPLAGQIPDGPLNGFVIYDERLVTVETYTGEIVLRDPKDVGAYHRLFGFFEQYAWFDVAARNLLIEYAAEFRKHAGR